MRPPWKRWPAVVVIMSASLVLAACSSSDPKSDPSPAASGTSSGSGFSTLDPAGIEQILASKVARLDMGSGTLDKAEVRVADDSAGPEIDAGDTGTIALTIAAPEGEILADTDRIRFNTSQERGDFSEVTYFLTADSPEAYFDLIREGVTRYGIDQDSAESWIASTEADLGGSDDFAITAGTSIGLEVSYDLRYDGSKDTQVIIVHVLPLE